MNYVHVFGQHCLNTGQMDKAHKLQCPGTYTNMPSNLRSVNKSINPGIFLDQECQNTICCRVFWDHRKEKNPQSRIHMSVQALYVLNIFLLRQTIEIFISSTRSPYVNFSNRSHQVESRITSIRLDWHE